MPVHIMYSWTTPTFSRTLNINTTSLSVAQQNEELLNQKKLLSDKSDEIKALKELLQLKDTYVDVNTQGIASLINKNQGMYNS